MNCNSVKSLNFLHIALVFLLSVINAGKGNSLLFWSHKNNVSALGNKSMRVGRVVEKTILMSGIGWSSELMCLAWGGCNSKKLTRADQDSLSNWGVQSRCVIIVSTRSITAVVCTAL